MNVNKPDFDVPCPDRIDDAEIRCYLDMILTDLESCTTPRDTSGEVDIDTTAADIFRAITGRRYCYLSRKKVDQYRDDVVKSVAGRMKRDEALRFFYDIGPGYHASTQPGKLPLRFDVGLSELLILYQIRKACFEVSQLYAPGAHFWLVVDNLCALRTNDIPVHRTESYVSQLRSLIRHLKMDKFVSLIVESETFDLREYDALLAEIEPLPCNDTPTADAIDNVARFLGRHCDAHEASMRIERYRRTGQVTDSLINRLVRDVHMTQRATGATLGFRPFPGGDQRTQAGELALTRNSKGRLKPVLLTSRNFSEYETERFEMDDQLPPQIPYVLAANRIS